MFLEINTMMIMVTTMVIEKALRYIATYFAVQRRKQLIRSDRSSGKLLITVMYQCGDVL